MYDVIVFEDGQAVWCVNLQPMTSERASDCLRMATALGAAWYGKDVRIIEA